MYSLFAAANVLAAASLYTGVSPGISVPSVEPPDDAATLTEQLALLPPAVAVMVQLPALDAVTVMLFPLVEDREAYPLGDTLHVTVRFVALLGETVAVRVELLPAVRLRADEERLTL